MTFATVAATVGLYIIAPKGFLPLQDSGSIVVVTEAGPDVSFTEMQARQAEIVDAFRKDGDVEGVVSVVGAGPLNPTPNAGRIVITLKQRDQRSDPIEEVIARLKTARGRRARACGCSFSRCRTSRFRRASAGRSISTRSPAPIAPT